MRQHALQFFIIQQIEDTAGHRDRSMLRVASGGKSIGRIAGNNVDFRHRQADALRKPLYYCVDARQILTRYRLGTIDAEGNLVGEKIGDKIQQRRNDQRNRQTALPAVVVAEKQQQPSQQTQQHYRLESICHESYSTHSGNWMPEQTGWIQQAGAAAKRRRIFLSNSETKTARCRKANDKNLSDFAARSATSLARLALIDFSQPRNRPNRHTLRAKEPGWRIAAKTQQSG